jgi:Ca2+/H+ antiporter
MELIYELFAFTAACVALVLLLKARPDKPVKPAIIALSICLGFDLLEIPARRYAGVVGAVESAALETFSALLAIIAIVYTSRFGKKRDERLRGYAILCTVLLVTIFGLELFFRLIIR